MHVPSAPLVVYAGHAGTGTGALTIILHPVPKESTVCPAGQYLHIPEASLYWFMLHVTVVVTHVPALTVIPIGHSRIQIPFSIL